MVVALPSKTIGRSVVIPHRAVPYAKLCWAFGPQQPPQPGGLIYLSAGHLSAEWRIALRL